MKFKFIKIRLIFAAVVLTATIAGISSCEKYSFIPAKINTADTIHFQADIQPIFNANCLSCHGATKAPDLRDGKSYAALTKGAFITPPGETSKLYTKMTGSDHSPRSGDTDKQKVLIWINQGALKN
jgi:hypothetical protein